MEFFSQHANNSPFYTGRILAHSNQANPDFSLGLAEIEFAGLST